MHNIEMHGMLEQDAAHLSDDILGRTETLTFADDIITTFINSECWTRSGGASPFLRLIGTDPREIRHVQKRLATIGIRMELFPIIENIPSSSSVT